MHYFVSIISEGSPVLECSFNTFEGAKGFYNSILKSGYSLSSDDYEIFIGSYSIDTEEEYIHEHFLLTKNTRRKKVSNTPEILLNTKLCSN